MKFSSWLQENLGSVGNFAPVVAPQMEQTSLNPLPPPAASFAPPADCQSDSSVSPSNTITAIQKMIPPDPSSSALPEPRVDSRAGSSGSTFPLNSPVTSFKPDSSASPSNTTTASGETVTDPSFEKTALGDDTFSLAGTTSAGTELPIPEVDANTVDNLLGGMTTAEQLGTEDSTGLTVGTSNVSSTADGSVPGPSQIKSEPLQLATPAWKAIEQQFRDFLSSDNLKTELSDDSALYRFLRMAEDQGSDLYLLGPGKEPANQSDYESDSSKFRLILVVDWAVIFVKVPGPSKTVSKSKEKVKSSVKESSQVAKSRKRKAGESKSSPNLNKAYI